MDGTERQNAFTSSNSESAMGKESTQMVAVYEMLRIKILKEIIFNIYPVALSLKPREKGD